MRQLSRRPNCSGVPPGQCEPPKQVCHLDRACGRLGALVPETSARARQGLVQVLGRENTEYHRQLHVELDTLYARSALASYEVEVRRLAAEHRPETNDGVVAAGRGHCHRCERQFERSWHPGNGSVCRGDTAAIELGQRAGEEQTGHVPVEPAAGHGDPQPGPVGSAPNAFALDVVDCRQTMGRPLGREVPGLLVKFRVERLVSRHHRCPRDHRQPYSPSSPAWRAPAWRPPA